MTTTMTRAEASFENSLPKDYDEEYYKCDGCGSPDYDESFSGFAVTVNDDFWLCPTCADTYRMENYPTREIL